MCSAIEQESLRQSLCAYAALMNRDLKARAGVGQKAKM